MFQPCTRLNGYANRNILEIETSRKKADSVRFDSNARDDTNDNKDEDLADLLQAIAFLQLRPGRVAKRVLKRLFKCENPEERMSMLHAVASSPLAQT